MSDHAGNAGRRATFAEQQDAERKGEDGFDPHHPEIGDGEVFPLHRQRLQGGSDDKQGKDDHGRPELGEPLRELHEDAADGEEKRGSHDHAREHARPHSPLSTYSAATM